MSMALLMAALVAGAVCGALGTSPSAPVDAVTLGLMAMLLEFRARPLGAFGFFTAAPAAYLAVGWSGHLGARLAVVLLVAGLLLRETTRAQAPPDRRLDEALSDGLPVLTSIAAVAALAFYRPQSTAPELWALGLVAYFPSWELAGRWGGAALPGSGAADFLRQRRAQVGTTVAAALAAPALLTLAGWKALLLLPLLLGLDPPAEAEPELPDPNLDRAVMEAEILSSDLAKTQEALQTKVEERLLLEQLTRSFAQAADLATTLELAVEMIRALLPTESVVFFLKDGEELPPAAWRSPHRQRLSDFSLLAVKEPIVEECFRSKRLLLSQPHHLHGDRLFPDEEFAVALPLSDFGVLYVGSRSSRRFTRKQLLLLALVADQTIPAILAGRRQDELRRALELHAASNRELEASNRRLSGLLSSFGELAQQLDLEFLLQRLPQTLKRLLPQHDWGALVAPERTHQWPGAPVEPTQLQPLVGAVREHGKPLLIEDFSATRFPSPGDGLQSALLVGLKREQRLSAVLVVGAKKAGAFSAAEFELLQTYCLHASALWHSSHLFNEVCQAHEALKESQAQLIQSSKLAAVGQLAAGVAHEINTPLGAVMISLQTAERNLKKGRPEKVQAKLEAAMGATRNAKSIIETLLEYSRPASQQQEIQVEQCVQAALKILGKPDGVRLQTELSPTPPIAANPTEIQQIVTNLVLNATQALTTAPVEKPQLWITTEVTPDRQILLAVEDNGPGIPEDTAERIFEPFFTTKPVGQGTGLGLSMSLTLAQRNQGSLSYRRGSGGGARFELKLPLERSDP